MREIKFRGKRIDNGEWVYGDYHYSYSRGCHFITESDGWAPTYNNPDKGEETVFHEIDPSTLGQFTCLKDKNGTEIYEGDIVQVDNHIPEDGEDESFDVITQCKWDKGMFILEDQAFGHWTRQLRHSPERLKVIGNIHENPELINEN